MGRREVSASGALGVVEAVRGRVGAVLAGDGDGRGLRVAVACSRFNQTVTERLLGGALQGLEECGVEAHDVTVGFVPGAFELPALARSLCQSATVDAVVCLGAVIRGETGHYDLVAGECARGLQAVQLDSGTPVAFGVLTTENLDQALARSVPLDQAQDPSDNKGWEAARCAVEMVRLLGAPSLRRRRGSTSPAGGC